MERYAPAHVVVGHDYEILRASSRTGKYLELAEGRPSTKVTELAKRGFRSAVRCVLDDARRNQKRTVKRDLRTEDNEAFTRLNGEFHRTILRSSGNRRIVELLASLDTIIVRYRRISLMFPDHVQRAFEDHTRILKLLSSGTPEAAEAFVRTHVLRAGARVVRAMSKMDGEVPRSGSTAAALLTLEQSGALLG